MAVLSSLYVFIGYDIVLVEWLLNDYASIYTVVFVLNSQGYIRGKRFLMYVIEFDTSVL